MLHEMLPRLFILLMQINIAVTYTLSMNLQFEFELALDTDTDHYAMGKGEQIALNVDGTGATENRTFMR